MEKLLALKHVAFFSVLFYSLGSWALGSRLPDPPASSPSPPPVTSPPPSQISEARTPPLWEARRPQAEGRDWTLHVLQTLDSIGKNILDVIPTDAETFCPNYSNLSYERRKDVWAFLISAMTRYESNFKPETKFQESFKDSAGNYVVSRGLLQISIESSQGYRCGITDANELHDPFKNLSCGIRILDRWLERDGRIAGQQNSSWRGGARYWSVLRTSSKSYPEIIKLVSNIRECRNPLL